MPTTTALTDAWLESTTIFCVAANTIPVRSKTFLDSKTVSNSIYSPTSGVATSAIAMLILDAVAPLLHIVTLATVYVAAGVKYTVASVAALISCAANLPVAMLSILHYDDKK